MLRTNRLCGALCAAGMYFNYQRRLMVLERPVVPQQVTGLPETKTLDDVLGESNGQIVTVWDHAE